MHLSGGTQNLAASIDEQLLSYLECEDNTELEEHLNHLIEHIAKPIVYQIVRRRDRLHICAQHIASGPTPHDLFGQVAVKLLQRLRTFKADPSHHAIANFAGLVATTTSALLADKQRANRPQRRNLEQKIRRLFAANLSLAIWKDAQNNSICGYAAWRGDKVEFIKSEGYPTLSELFLRTDDLRSNSRNTADAILLILSAIDRPIRLGNLVDLLRATSGGSEVQTISIDEPSFMRSSLAVLSTQPDNLGAIENRLLLQRLFAEIQKLGLAQRKSLLLHMTRSYGYSIEWFLFTKIATEQQLAGLLELSVDAFRLLLDDLPMTDKEIASQLGTTPKKVANIRKAVRDRLERCRHAFLNQKNTPQR